jgi:Cys-tRNA(Pro) deacylase
MDLPEAARRVADAARRHGLDIEVTVYPDGTKTAADAAAAIGCPVSAIVKSLVFVVDDRPVVCLVPGDQRLDPARLAAETGATSAGRAPLDTVRKATGYAAGGTPPFGHTTEIQVLADVGLRRHEIVWAAAGTPTTVFPIALEDLVRASGARWAELAAG